MKPTILREKSENPTKEEEKKPEKLRDKLKFSRGKCHCFVGAVGNFYVDNIKINGPFSAKPEKRTEKSAPSTLERERTISGNIKLRMMTTSD